MRTTIEIDDPLFRRLKVEAARQGESLKEVVNDTLRQGLAAPRKRKKYVFLWRTDPPGKILPGVGLNDRDSPFDLMDGRG